MLNEGAEIASKPRQNQIDMELANYIYSIIRSKLMIMFSWGFHNPVAINNGLKFQVNGYRHTGAVTVELTPLDEFKVSLMKQGKVIKVIDGVYIDNLVQVIDEAVERVPNYENRVKQTYGIK